MSWTNNYHKYRGSVEVILLIIVLVAIAAIIGWRLTANMWQPKQEPTESEKVENTVLAEGRTLARVLDLSFKVPEEHGDVIIMDSETGTFPSVELAAEKLEKAKYNCEGENFGSFGKLALVDSESHGPQPQFTKKFGEQTYGFTSNLTKACYSDELLKEFRETAPAAIVESLEKLEVKQEESKEDSEKEE